MTPALDVLFICPNAGSGFGGSGVQMAYLCRHLRTKGWSAAIVFRAGNAADYFLQRPSVSMLKLFADLPRFLLPNQPKASDVEDILRQTRPRLLYIHAGLFFRLAAALAAFDGKVVLYCGADVDTQNSTSSLAAAAPKVAAIVAISGKYGVFCAQALHRWRPKVACPVVVIRQGTYCSFDPAEGDYIEQVTAGRPFCLSIGTTRSYKQFDHFIRAVIHLQRRKAAEMGVVVGPLTTDWLSSVKKFYPVQVLPGGMVGLGPVLFVGPSMYTGNWYSRAQCCLCTSTSYEGIPGALREAMLVRCLTGSYNIGSIAELMRGGKCGVVSPLGDPTRLADGVAKLLRDTMSKRKMVAGAHAHVLDCFSAGEHCKQSEALLRDILETT